MVVLTLLIWAGGFSKGDVLADSEYPESQKQLQPQALNAVGVYELRRMDPNLTGKGVNLALISRSFTYVDDKPQNDYRPNTEHRCLQGSQISFYDAHNLPAGISPHSTSVCSVLLGKDPNAFNSQLGNIYYQGAVPDAKLDVYEFRHFLINNVFGQSPPEADIVIACIGSQFEDWWTRGIESLAQQYGITIIAGIGNGLNVYDPPLYPAASANVIGVGVVDSVNSQKLETNLKNFALAYPEHSTCGPTIDERCKPDIVAPGNCLVADSNNTKQYKPAGNWTSFATPVVAGIAALLVQKAGEDPNLSPAVSSKSANCLIKAILLNSAKKLPFWHKGKISTDDDHVAVLDYIQGAGMVNATNAYQHLIAGQNKPGEVPEIGWDLNRLPKSKTLAKLYRLTINKPEDKFITATLVWNKHYNSTYPFEPQPQMDADLRLELWAVNPDNPDDHYLLDYSDSNTDNLEHIYTQADPNYTSYEIVVLNKEFDEPDRLQQIQHFAIAWNVSASQQTEGILLYDLNADGIVNESDVKKLFENRINSAKSPDMYFIGDINANGIFDINDFKTLMDNMNRSADWYEEPHYQ